MDWGVIIYHSKCVEHYITNIHLDNYPPWITLWPMKCVFQARLDKVLTAQFLTIRNKIVV